MELPNFMFFAGKSYRRYASPINASLLHFADGDLHGDTLMRQVVSGLPPSLRLLSSGQCLGSWG